MGTWCSMSSSCFRLSFSPSLAVGGATRGGMRVGDGEGGRGGGESALPPAHQPFQDRTPIPHSHTPLPLVKGPVPRGAPSLGPRALRALISSRSFSGSFRSVPSTADPKRPSDSKDPQGRAGGLRVALDGDTRRGAAT